MVSRFVLSSLVLVAVAVAPGLGASADARRPIADVTPAIDNFNVSTPPPLEGGGDVALGWSHKASFEFSLSAGVDAWRVDSPFEVTRTSEAGGAEGSYAVKIVTNGGDGSCSCPRMKYENGFSYGPGTSVWISGSWKIPEPDKVAWSRLMNLGHYEGVTGKDWYLALESTDPGTMEIAYAPYGNPHVAVLPARPIPANRWFRVDVHFVLSATDGQALTEWFIDGQLIGSTTKANMYQPTPLHFYNAGLPFFLPANGNTTVYFDAPRLTSP
jgi:hypothetical protein